jgi:positive regulator of sigma E activity
MLNLFYVHTDADTICSVTSVFGCFTSAVSALNNEWQQLTCTTKLVLEVQEVCQVSLSEKRILVVSTICQPSSGH